MTDEHGDVAVTHAGGAGSDPHAHGPTVVDRALMHLLRSPLHRLFSRSVAVLTIRGAVSGRTITLPVQFARYGADFVVVPARPESKRWWRNLRSKSPVDMLVRGLWISGEALALTPSDPAYASARTAYALRWPKVQLRPTNPVVLITTEVQDGADHDDYPID